MSYSFSVQAASKDEAKQKVAVEFDKIIASQPTHSHDKDAALNAVNAFVDLVTLPDGREIQVSVHGSLGWQGDDPTEFSGAGVGVSVRVA